ncbi:MAG: hypothetical protein U1F23_01290 [Lysobacterales bacterium]
MALATIAFGREEVLADAAEGFRKVLGIDPNVSAARTGLSSRSSKRAPPKPRSISASRCAAARIPQALATLPESCSSAAIGMARCAM